MADFAKGLGEHWQIPDEAVGTFITLPNLGKLNTLLACKDLDSFQQSSLVNNNFLLRKDTVERWNALAWSLRKEDRDGPLGRVLLGPSGFGKSMEAYFCVCLARECGWLVQYMGSVGQWLVSQSPEIAALEFLRAIRDLNKGSLGIPLVGDVLTDTATAAPAFHGTTLADLLAFVSANNSVAILRAVRKLMATHTAAPVLSIMDDHQALWNKLGKEIAKWDPFFTQFTDFPAGTRIVTIYLGSQHAEFEISMLPNAYQKFCMWMQPFTLDEYRTFTKLPAFPQLLRDNEDYVRWLTNLVPRDIISLATESLMPDWPQTMHAFEETRYSTMQLTFAQYHEGLSGKAEKQFYTTLRDTLLPVLATRNPPHPAFLDRGLVYRNRSKDVVPINKHARKLLVDALLANAKSLPLDELHTLIFTSAGMDQSVRGTSFEELFLSDMLFLPVTIESTDEYGKAFPDHSGSISMHADDYLVLQKGAAMLPFVPMVPTLVRGYAKFPVWDFVYVDKAVELHMSTVVFIQCSVSPFRRHDTGTAEIATAFVADGATWGEVSRRERQEAAPSSRPRSCVEALLDTCLGVTGHVAKHNSQRLSASSPDGKEMPNVHFLYVTTGEPTKGTKGKYTNLRFAFSDRLPMRLKELAATAQAVMEPGRSAASGGSAKGKQKREKSEDEQEVEEHEREEQAIKEPATSKGSAKGKQKHENSKEQQRKQKEEQQKQQEEAAAASPVKRAPVKRAVAAPAKRGGRK